MKGIKKLTDWGNGPSGLPRAFKCERSVHVD